MPGNLASTITIEDVLWTRQKQTHTETHTSACTQTDRPTSRYREPGRNDEQRERQEDRNSKSLSLRQTRLQHGICVTSCLVWAFQKAITATHPRTQCLALKVKTFESPFIKKLLLHSTDHTITQYNRLYAVHGLSTREALHITVPFQASHNSSMINLFRDYPTYHGNADVSGVGCKSTVARVHRPAAEGVSG